MSNSSFISLLSRLEDPPFNLFKDYATLVMDSWTKLQKAAKGLLEHPSFKIIDYGCVFSWDHVNYCLDIELEFNGDLHWFYYNKETKCSEGTEEPIKVDDLSKRLIELLQEQV